MCVDLAELQALFTGVPNEDLTWSTVPCYSIPLAFEIARRCDTASENQLRTILYDTTPADLIPADAIEAIRLAVQRYRQHRDLQKAGRGL